MSYVPDGYHSDCTDEDELELFCGNDEWDDHKYERDPPAQYKPSAKEMYQTKYDNFYSNVVAGSEDAVAEALKDLNVNVEFRDDWTPLLLAASVGNRKIVQLLLENGADVHKHKDHFTALMAACKCPDSTSLYMESATIIKLLINYGIDVNLKTRKRMTAFMYAASCGNRLAIEILLPICDIHAVDNQGWHALFWAVNDRRINIVHLLIEAGLNVEQVDVRKQSLIEFALNDCIEEIILAIAPDTYTNKLNNTYSEKMFSYFTDECSTLSEISKKPNFYREVSLLLHGSRSEQYLSQFMENNIDLYSYLTMDDAGLQKIGISAPFQRYRILHGIYRFHKYPYKIKSIPVGKMGTEQTSLDSSKAIICCIRQLIAMEASIEYLISHGTQIEASKDIVSSIASIRNKIKCLKNYCTELETLANEWDKFNAPVDIINKKSIKQIKRFSLWYKLIPIGSIFIAGYFYIKKNN